jgi:hypothetical protein
MSVSEEAVKESKKEKRIVTHQLQVLRDQYRELQGDNHRLARDLKRREEAYKELVSFLEILF